MRKVRVLNHGLPAGILTECDDGLYRFEYHEGYGGPPISLSMPVAQKSFEFYTFPPFFDGLLPEGSMLEALLKQAKLDTDDYLGQLMTVGQDMVGSVTVEAIDE